MIATIVMLYAAKWRDRAHRIVRELDRLEAQAAELEATGLDREAAWSRVADEALGGAPEPKVPPANGTAG